MASARSLGTLTLDLVAKTSAFTASLDKAARDADARLAKIERSAKVVGAAIGVAVVAVGAALANMVNNTINAMDELSKLAQSTGVAVEELSALTYAADLSGVSQDQLGTALVRLTKNMSDAAQGTGEAQKGFEALGISVKNSEGGLKSSSQVLTEVAAKFAQYEDGAEKTALAVNLFGKSGADLIPLLNSGADGLEEMTDQARELGLTFDGETGRAAEAFNDNLSRLSAVKQGLVTRITVELLPSLERLSERFFESAKSAENLDRVARIASTGVKLLATAGVIVTGVFNAVGEALGGVGAVIVQLVQGNFSQAFDIANNATTDFFNNFNGTVGAVADIWDEAAGNIAEDSEDTATKIAAPVIKAAEKVDREAQRIAKAMQDMAKMQRDWQRELDGTGNKVADDFEKRALQIQSAVEGFERLKVPASNLKEFTDQMTRLSESLREKQTIEYIKEFDFQTRSMVASLTPGASALLEFERSVYELDREMKAGIITADDYQRRLSSLESVRDRDSTNVLRSLNLEIEALGKSAEWIETRNALLDAGVTAESDMGRAISETVRQLYEQGQAIDDQVELMDTFRGAASNALQDVMEGTKSLKDVFVDMLDTLVERINKIVADKLIEQLFGQTGTTQAGSQGGWISTLIGAFFGGGRATGGAVSSGKFYEVGEGDSPELLMAGGRQYLIPGNQGSVRPMNRGGGGSMVNNFNFAAPTSAKTQTQVASRVGYEVRRSQRLGA